MISSLKPGVLNLFVGSSFIKTETSKKFMTFRFADFEDGYRLII